MLGVTKNRISPLLKDPETLPLSLTSGDLVPQDVDVGFRLLEEDEKFKDYTLHLFLIDLAVRKNSWKDS